MRYFNGFTFLLVCRRLSAVARSPPLKIRTSREEKTFRTGARLLTYIKSINRKNVDTSACLLYTSDAADE